MTTGQAFAGIVASVKTDAQESIDGLLESVRLQAVEFPGLRELESTLWKGVVGVGRQLLTLELAQQCRQCTERELEAQGLSVDDVRMRLDRDYWARLNTTFGPIEFPLYAYRESRAGASVTRTPARSEVLPLYPRCRSSELCLEWESRLGKAFPYREAERMLAFFSHEALTLEDTTIAAHMVAVGNSIEPSWLYRSPEAIREVLQERATRDRKTGRPLIYFSSDAHALRRFVDETWSSAWKMANGLRLWCVDRHTGQVIHLGGEYTWGDCHQVGAIVERLVDTGILPPDADYGGGLVAQLVVVTDGLEWIENHVVRRLPWAQPILDIYHVVEHLVEFAAACFGRATAKARRWLARAKTIIFGNKPTSNKASDPKPRRGQKRSKRVPENEERYQPVDVHAGEELVLELLATHEELGEGGGYDAFDELIGYLDNNTHRTDYRRYRNRGFQIGSGAMESLHRNGSQLRLKVPGPGWLAHNAQAVFNLRMLDLVGHWDHFWSRPDLTERLVYAFNPESSNA